MTDDNAQQHAVHSVSIADRKPWLSSKTLAIAALGFWLVSLTQIGLVFSDDRVWRGLNILVWGWVTVLQFNLAWLANPLFVWALVRILQCRGAIVLSASIFVFSLFTFALKTAPTLGGTMELYGYGWGVVIWLLSFSLLIASAGALEIENRIERNSIPDHGAEILRPIGFLLSILICVLAIHYATKDRATANQEQLRHLEKTAFKSGHVCSVEIPVTQPNIVLNSGALEVVVANKNLHAYPFDKPETLLGWGIPKVRVGNRDFYYEELDGGRALMSAPVTTPPAMQLHVSHTKIKPGDNSKINLRLSSMNGGRIHFDQTWTEERSNSSRFCPLYSWSPSEDMQPRKMLMEAFGIAVQPATHPTKSKSVTAATDHFKATIVSTKESIEKPVARGRGDIESPRAIGSFGRVGNRNCPKDVGWRARIEDIEAVRREDGSLPFSIGEKTYFLGMQEGYNALCKGSYVYLSSSGNVGGKHLTLEKRSLSNFQLIWRKVVDFDQLSSKVGDPLTLTTIDESDASLTLGVTNEAGWNDMVVTVSLKK